MLVIAVVMILVVGPKDLPGMLRTIGKTVGNLRRMAGDFQRQFSDALKEADIDEIKNSLTKSTSIGNPLADITKSAEELMGSLDTDDDYDELAKEKFDKFETEIAEGKAKAKSSAVKAKKTTTAKKALAKKTVARKTPVKKAPAKKVAVAKATTNSVAKSKQAVKKPVVKKPAAKPAAKRQTSAKSKTMTGSKPA